LIEERLADLASHERVEFTTETQSRLASLARNPTTTEEQPGYRAGGARGE
jgi:hypothetical protein